MQLVPGCGRRKSGNKCRHEDFCCAGIEDFYCGVFNSFTLFQFFLSHILVATLMLVQRDWFPYLCENKFMPTPSDI
jgi:hypothetical protein